MTRQEAEFLFGWIRNSYPRNYKDADPRQLATAVDNLADVFSSYSYQEVLAEYKRRYATQKNEPHPSEIRAAIKGETKKRTARATDDPLTVLRRHPKWDDICRAYGERTVIRQAKLCVETATINELQFRLERDQ